MISGTRYQLTREVNRQLKLATDIGRAQSEISAGGKRILSPSDDPVGAARVADIVRSEANGKTWKTNLNAAAALSSNAEGVLKTLSASFQRVNELMLAVANGTLAGEDRAAAALEIESIAEEVAVLRDTRDSRGLPLFPTASEAIRIPVGPDLDVAPVGTREAVFEGVATPGGLRSLSTILSDAVTAVRSNDPAAIQAALAETNAASAHVIASHAAQGSRGARIDTLLDRNLNGAVDMEIERGSIENSDITQLVATIQARQLSLDAAQATFARINRSTLFDLLS